MQLAYIADHFGVLELFPCLSKLRRLRFISLATTADSNTLTSALRELNPDHGLK